MIALDANILSLIIYPRTSVPNDYRTDAPIALAKERAEQLVETAQKDGDVILIGTPVLAEVLVVVADQIERYVAELENSQPFRVKPFGTKAAIELALRTRSAKEAGDKKDGAFDPWQKVKYDRQLVAIAKVEGASVVYSTDHGVLQHASAFGIRGCHLADVELRPKQLSLDSTLEPSGPQSTSVVPEPPAGPSEDSAEVEKSTTSVKPSERPGVANT